MHELAITQELNRLIKEESKGKTPKEVFVEMGVLTTYEPDSVKFYFKELGEFPKTKLFAKKIPVKIKCECGKVSEFDEPVGIWCDCGGDFKIVDGKDFKITKIVF